MHWTMLTAAFLVITAGYLLWFGLRRRITASRAPGRSVPGRVLVLGLDVLLLPWVLSGRRLPTILYSCGIIARWTGNVRSDYSVSS